MGFFGEIKRGYQQGKANAANAERREAANTVAADAKQGVRCVGTQSNSPADIQASINLAINQLNAEGKKVVNVSMVALVGWFGATILWEKMPASPEAE